MVLDEFVWLLYGWEGWGGGVGVKGYGLSKGIGLIIIEVKGEHSFYTPTLITV